MPSGQMPSGEMEAGNQASEEQGTTEVQMREMPYVPDGPESLGVVAGSGASGLSSGKWSLWELHQGSTAIYAPAATAWGENRIDLFAIGLNSQIYHQWWNGKQWSEWEFLEGTYTISAPAAVSVGKNRLDVFWIGIDKQVYRRSWNGNQWSQRESLGGVAIHGVAATSWGLDRIDLFTVGTDSSLYHKSWNGSMWSAWKIMKFQGHEAVDKSSTCISAPAAVSWGANRIDVFALGIDNYAYHAWGDGLSEWRGWEKLGGPCIHGVAAASRGVNTLDLFSISTDTIGTDNHMYHRSWNGSNWSRWENLGGACISAPAAVSWGENRLDAFVIGTKSALYQKSWTKESGSLGVSSNNYNSVQFIGYVLPTGVFIEEIDNINGRVTQKYLGSSDFELDWQSRCTLMEEAIDLAFQKANTDSSTLKVFVAPEFYFRGPLGAYSLEIFDKIVQRLRNKVSNQKWEHWLFVFGTILGTAELASGKKEIYNTALIQKGYIPDMQDVAYEAKAVIKEYKSDIDFAWKKDSDSQPWDLFDKHGNSIPEDTLVQWKLVDDSLLSDDQVESIFKKENSTGSGKEQQKWSYDGLGIFEIDGITFGLEICLDHANRRLRLSPPASGQNKVQIQLIPSGGMDINADAVMAVKDGLVFNCDGSGDGHAHLVKVTQEFDQLSNATISDVNPKKIIDIPQSANVAQPDLYFEKPGELVIYDPQDIPAASVVP